MLLHPTQMSERGRVYQLRELRLRRRGLRLCLVGGVERRGDRLPKVDGVFQARGGASVRGCYLAPSEANWLLSSATTLRDISEKVYGCVRCAGEESKHVLRVVVALID